MISYLAVHEESGLIIISDDRHEKYFGYVFFSRKQLSDLYEKYTEAVETYLTEQECDHTAQFLIDKLALENSETDLLYLDHKFCCHLMSCLSELDLYTITDTATEMGLDDFLDTAQIPLLLAHQEEDDFSVLLFDHDGNKARIVIARSKKQLREYQFISTTFREDLAETFNFLLENPELSECSDSECVILESSISGIASRIALLFYVHATIIERTIAIDDAEIILLDSSDNIGVFMAELSDGNCEVHFFFSVAQIEEILRDIYTEAFRRFCEKTEESLIFQSLQAGFDDLGNEPDQETLIQCSPICSALLTDLYGKYSFLTPKEDSGNLTVGMPESDQDHALLFFTASSTTAILTIMYSNEHILEFSGDISPDESLAEDIIKNSNLPERSNREIICISSRRIGVVGKLVAALQQASNDTTSIFNPYTKQETIEA